jgi:hypothetical protein
MTKIFGLCPRCKSRIKIDNVERLDGRKILCRDCGYTIRIRNPKQALARPESEEVEVFDLDEGLLLEDPNAALASDDEYADAIDEDSELPAYRPLARRPKAKNSAADVTDQTAGAFVPNPGGKGGARQKKKSPLLIILTLVGGLAIVGLAAGGLVWLRGSGLGKSAKYEPPQNYVTFAPKAFELSAKIPEGWTTEYGGGQSGIPMFARFASDSISIQIRESIAGGALGQAAIALQGNSPQIPKEAPVVGIHEMHRKEFEEAYKKYNETMTRPIKTRGYGEGRISDFTAAEGLLGLPIKGCRATMMNSIHQFTVTCKCSVRQFKDVRPVFEKIVGSISTGGD